MRKIALYEEKQYFRRALYVRYGYGTQDTSAIARRIHVEKSDYVERLIQMAAHKFAVSLNQWTTVA